MTSHRSRRGRRHHRRTTASAGRTVAALVTVAVGVVLLGLGLLGAVHGAGASAGVPKDFGTLESRSAAVAAPTASPSATAWTASATRKPIRTGAARTGTDRTGGARTGAAGTTVARPTHGSAPARSSAKPADAGVPVEVRLPELQVRAAVTPVVSNDGVLTVPEDPQVLGWWAGGARPGQVRGTVVIDGHVDSAVSGPGALYQLENLSRGDAVQVITATGHTVSYRVVARRSYAKTSGLPASIFTSTGPARLALVTCGGPFDKQAGSYEDNVVVVAEPVRP